MTPLDPALRAQLLAPPADGVVDVVIDTDATNEVDDQLAIVWALLRPDRLRVRGLHACPYAVGPQVLVDPGFLAPEDRDAILALGVAPEDVPVVAAPEGVARAAAECRRLVDLVGVDVPVLDGATRAMTDPEVPVRSDAVEHLIALAHEDREGPLHVLGMGAATNLASAVLVDPTVRERVAVVWTSAYPTFWPYPNASFNLAQDLPAAHALLGSGVPLVYLPGYYVGEQLRASRAELEVLRGSGPVGDEVLRMCTESGWFGERPGTSKVVWDLVDVAWVLDPSWLQTSLVPTPGLTADLRWSRVPDAPEMREAHGIRRDAVWQDFYATVAGTR